jgi:hypothetical protein
LGWGWGVEDRVVLGVEEQEWEARERWVMQKRWEQDWT